MKDDALIEQILAEDEQEVVDNEDIAEDKHEEGQALDDATQVGDVVEEVSEPIQEVVIPDNWEPQLKDFVTSIEDVNGKQVIIDKLSNFEKGYQGKFQTLADEKKAFEDERTQFTTDKQVVESYKQLEQGFEQGQLEQINNSFGGTPQYFNYLKEMDMMASKDPATFLLNISNSNNIDLAQLAEMQKNPAMQQNYQTQNRQQSFEQQQSKKIQELEEKFNARVEQEANDKFLAEKLAVLDESGKQKYAHLSNESVLNSMEYLAQQNPNADFDTLYQESLYMVPDIRNGILNQNNQVQTATQQASKALSPKQVKSSVSSSKTKRKMSESEIIDEVLNDFA